MHRMTRSAILATLFVLCTPPLLADYIADREAAAGLMDAGKYDEALESFTAMAAGEVTDLQKSDALDQASQCAVAMKEYDRAMELAKQIPLGPQSKRAQMAVLHTHGNRQFDRLIEQFGDEDLVKWPEHVAADAWLMRGEAAVQAGRLDLAVTDLPMALRFPMRTRERAETLVLLGSVYKRLGREEDALAAWRRAHELPDPYRAALAAMSMARIHTARGEHAQAISILDTIDLDQLKPAATYCGWALEAMGDARAAAGDTEDAIARYKQAIEIEGVPDHFKAACEKKIATLRGTEEP